MTLVVAALVGLLVGGVVGALGAGGGILSVPVLVHVLGLPPHAAATASLVIVLLTAVCALPQRARLGQVRWRDGLVFGLLGSVGAWLGSWLNALAAEQVLMTLFSVLLGCVSVVMARRAATERRVEQTGPTGPTGTGPTERAGQDGGAAPATAAAPARAGDTRPGHLSLVAAATATGLLTGFFGVGGGFVVVPVLVLVLRIPTRQAAGTSLLVMTVTACVALAQRAGSGAWAGTDWGLVAVFATASALGGLVGGPVSQRLRPWVLTALFAALLAAVAVGSALGTALG